VVGDGELDEGNVWEAVTEPAAAALGNVLWVVDHNRQSLDQPVPQARVPQRKALFASPGGTSVGSATAARCRSGSRSRTVRRCARGSTPWPDAEHRAMSRLAGPALRRRIHDYTPPQLAASVAAALADVPDADLAPLVQDFGGTTLLRCWRPTRSATRWPTDRP